MMKKVFIFGHCRLCAHTACLSCAITHNGLLTSDGFFGASVLVALIAGWQPHPRRESRAVTLLVLDLVLLLLLFVV